jgi:hypothetical protein
MKYEGVIDEEKAKQLLPEIFPAMIYNRHFPVDAVGI